MTHEWNLAPLLAPMLAPTLGLYKQFLPLLREVTAGESQECLDHWQAVINPTVVRLSINKFFYKVTQCSVT